MSLDLTCFEASPLTDSKLKSHLRRFTHFPATIEWLLGSDHKGTVLTKLIKNTADRVQPDRAMGWRKQFRRLGGEGGVKPEDR